MSRVRTPSPAPYTSSKVGLVSNDDPWKRKFMYGICDVFGMPASSVECGSRSERVMLAWSVLHMTQAMVKHRDIFDEVKGLDPTLAADEFVKSFYDKTGRMVIPQMPISSSSDAKQGGSV